MACAIFVAIGKTDVLSNVRLHGGHQRLGLRVLADQLHNQRILNCGCVNLDVGFVVLVGKGLQRLAHQHVLVLRHWVGRLLVGFQRHQLVRIFDTQDVEHLTVQLRQVIDLGGLLSHLHDGLVLNNTLR